METTILLDATEVTGIVAELMPLIWALIIIVPVFYVISIALLIKGKSIFQRVTGWVIAVLQMGIGVYIMFNPTNQWGLYSALFYMPVSVGILTEYWCRRNISHA
jgi:hypothetical protein